MLKKEEIGVIIASSIILAFAISAVETIQIFLYSLLFIFLIIIANIFAKKITAYYFESEIKIRIWRIKRYGYRAHDYFKKPFLAGAFFPLISMALSMGNIIWMASIVFDPKERISKAARRHWVYKYSELNESEIGWIATAGIAANLIFAIICIITGFPELAKINIYYSFFNMLPLSDLDGNKIFFGGFAWWAFLFAITTATTILAVIY